MRSLIIAPMCALFYGLIGAAVAQPSGPTVREVVEFKRIAQPYNQNEDALPEQVSPDGKQAFIVTRQSNVESDRNRYEILLLDLTPEHLAAQREPRPQLIFAATPEIDGNYSFPGIASVQWHGDHTLVFMGRLRGEVYQVYSLDVRTRELTQLTHQTDRMMSYAVSQDLRRVLYSAQVPNPPLKAGQHGVVVGSQSFWAVKFGQHDIRGQDRIYRYFVSDTTSPQTPRPLGDAFPDSFAGWPVVSMSPDGRWAVLPRWEPERLSAWEQEYPAVAEFSRTYTYAKQVDPLGYFARPVGYTPRRMTAWRLDDGKEQTILDAPDDAQPGSSQDRQDRLWQGAGESVVLAGTHLPLVRGSQASTGSYVLEYWPDTGRWAIIAKLQTELGDAHALPGGFVLTDGEKRRKFHRQADGGWREVTEDSAGSDGSKGAWKLRIVEGLNQPADIYAVGPGGENRRLTALNPQFDPQTWGTMQPYSWHDEKGATWDGGLLTGRGMDGGTRLPLLIQTYGFSPNRFFLDGENLGDGGTSAFAGRAFLREGMMVLQLPLGPNGVTGQSERARQAFFDAAVRSAVEALVKEGRVDPAKVGILGWSHTGQRVLNLITFNDFPIRSATMADGDANTLFGLTLIYGRSDGMLQGDEESNDGVPYGSKMSTWVRNDPSLHTDCIRAAVRIESYGPPVYNNWDIYGLLRRQYKAADMIVIPGGSHSLSTPGDRMVSLQGNVDWHAFWLAGRTRSAPTFASETEASVALQYDHWRQMAALKAADDARPRCVR